MRFLGHVVDWFANGDHWRGREGVPYLVVQHLEISAISLLCAVLIALPIGLALGHVRRGGFLAVNVSNIGRALPSLAILLLAVLAFGVGTPPTVFRTVGIGSIPTFIALVALAVPPVLTNTYVGMAGIDADLREAARGMGMSGVQMLRRVELPVALPLIMAGVRTSAVAVVATATLAAYVGWGGLGRYIIDGLAVSDNVQVFAGAFLVAMLSIVVELALGAAQRLVVSRGLQVRERPAAVVIPQPAPTEA
ncbi:MAG: ABC transporter permease [Actinobacteria bacterium]|nr:ABC transporter permease [Actinomycetota bacterium]